MTTTRFSTIRFRNYKALRDFSVSLKHMNILVGPNNSGKSTIIGAVRVLAAGIGTARAKSPESVETSAGERLGYRIPESSIPISLENVHTNYQDVEASVRFRLSNGNHLTLIFPAGTRECYLIPHATDRTIVSPSGFRAAFPVTLGIVPVLGPVEHEEQLVQPETIRRYLTTHRASRHFRSFWYHFPENFERFRAAIRESWPEMDVQRPELEDRYSSTVRMFCLENALTRELYWSGFGFQVWCQALTHLVRADETSLIVIDEPEIYLHPDLQRQLLQMLRDLGPDILVATHSSELVAEADPPEVLMIDKTRKAADRLVSFEGVRTALDALGTTQNVILSRIARTRRVIFVEGDDFRLLARFAKRLALAQLATEAGLSVAPLGRFPTATELLRFAEGIRSAIGEPLMFGVILDRDYRSDQEVDEFVSALRGHFELVHIHSRKELENYLLNPVSIDRALRRASRDGGSEPEPSEPVLTDLTSEIRHEVQAQYVSHQLTTQRKTGKDQATITAAATKAFDSRWQDLISRLAVVPGKEVVGKLIAHYQTTAGINVTPAQIASAFHADEIDQDMRNLLNQIERFRKREPGGKSK